MDTAQRYQDLSMIGLRPCPRPCKLRQYTAARSCRCLRLRACNALGNHSALIRPVPGQLSTRVSTGAQQHRSSTVAHAKRAKAIDAANRSAGNQQQQHTSWQQQLSSSMSQISNKQLFQLVLPGRDVPLIITTPSTGSSWAAFLAAAVLAAGAFARLLSHNTATSGHQQTHLQALAAAAAAAAAAGSNADFVVSVSGALVSGALLELEQHRQQLASYKQEVDLLHHDASVSHSQLSAKLQVAEAELKKAKQVSAALDKELSLISGLLQQQHSALADLASDASADAAAHRESLTGSQRKVRLLDEMLLTMRQRLAEADSNREALMQGAVSVSAAELSSAESACADLAQQIADLQTQLNKAQSRLSAAESQTEELEGHLSLLTGVKQQMAGRLTQLEDNAAAAAAAAKQAVASAEAQLSSISAAAAEETSAVAAVAAALQQRQQELDTLHQQLKVAQDELGTAAAEARAAAAAAAIIGQATMQGYPVEGQPSDVTVTVRHTPSAAAAAAAVTAAAERQHEQQCGAAVAGLSAAVLLKAAEVSALQVELEEQLIKVRSAAAGRTSQLLNVLSCVSSDLAAAQQQAEGERVQLAAVRDGMAEVFQGLMKMTETSSSSSSNARGRRATEATQEKYAAATATSSKGDDLRQQLQEIKAGISCHVNELEVMMSLARMRLTQEKQVLIEQLEQRQDNQKVLELLRSKLHPELLDREQTLRQELQQLQHQQHSLEQQLVRVEAAEAAAERAAAEKAAREKAAREARAKAAADKAAREKAAAEARAKAEEEARVARDKAAEEQARLRATAQARAREEAAALEAAKSAAAEEKAAAAAAREAARKADEERLRQAAAAAAAEAKAREEAEAVAAAAASELAAAKVQWLIAQEAAEECYQNAKQQQSAIQQQQQLSDASLTEHAHAQLSQLTILQAQLQQQGDQLAAFRYRYEEGLAHTAAAASEASVEVVQITQELTRLQSAFKSCHVELLALAAAAEATIMGKADSEVQQAEQQVHAYSSRNGNSSSSSSSRNGGRGSGDGNKRTIAFPGVDGSNGAVLYVGDAASGIRHQQQWTRKTRSTGSRNGPSGAAASAATTETPALPSAATTDTDDILSLAQKLLDGNGSSSSGSSSVAPSGTTSALRQAAAAAAVTTALLPPKQQVLRLRSAGYLLPHPAKAAAGGEDAFFVSDAGCGCLGVADGVGSWAEEGINAAAYAQGLMTAAADVCESAGGSESPQDVLTYAQARTEAAGSCTALVAVLRPSQVLDVCVVGDVGLRIIRDNDITFATEVQEHAFNMPFQLACLDIIPEADTPAAGLLYNTPLCAGDVIIAGSDGLFDNMWDEQLTNIVTQSMRCLPPSSSSWNSDVAADVARRIAESAAANAVNPEFKSPWAVETQQRVPNTLGLMSRLFGPRGGKIDDIAVVVALVV